MRSAYAARGGRSGSREFGVELLHVIGTVYVTKASSFFEEQEVSGHVSPSFSFVVVCRLKGSS